MRPTWLAHSDLPTALDFATGRFIRIRWDMEERRIRRALIRRGRKQRQKAEGGKDQGGDQMMDINSGASHISS